MVGLKRWHDDTRRSTLWNAALAQGPNIFLLVLTREGEGVGIEQHHHVTFIGKIVLLLQFPSKITI